MEWTTAGDTDLVTDYEISYNIRDTGDTREPDYTEGNTLLVDDHKLEQKGLALLYHLACDTDRFTSNDHDRARMLGQKSGLPTDPQSQFTL